MKLIKRTSPLTLDEVFAPRDPAWQRQQSIDDQNLRRRYGLSNDADLDKLFVKSSVLERPARSSMYAWDTPAARTELPDKIGSLSKREQAAHEANQSLATARAILYKYVNDIRSQVATMSMAKFLKVTRNQLQLACEAFRNAFLWDLGVDGYFADVANEISQTIPQVDRPQLWLLGEWPQSNNPTQPLASLIVSVLGELPKNLARLTPYNPMYLMRVFGSFESLFLWLSDFSFDVRTSPREVRALGNIHFAWRTFIERLGRAIDGNGPYREPKFYEAQESIIPEAIWDPRAPQRMPTQAAYDKLLQLAQDPLLNPATAIKLNNLLQNAWPKMRNAAANQRRPPQDADIFKMQDILQALARNPNLPARELEKLITVEPVAAGENPMIDLFSLENPQFFFKNASAFDIERALASPLLRKLVLQRSRGMLIDVNLSNAQRDWKKIEAETGWNPRAMRWTRFQVWLFDLDPSFGQQKPICILRIERPNGMEEWDVTYDLNLSTIESRLDLRSIEQARRNHGYSNDTNWTYLLRFAPNTAK